MPLNDPVPSKNIQEVLSRNLEDFDKIVNSEDLEVTLRTGEPRPTTKALQINNEEATQAKTDAESARDAAVQAKEQTEQTASQAQTDITNSRNAAVTTVNSTRDSAVTTVNNTRDTALSDISSARTAALDDVANSTQAASQAASDAEGFRDDTQQLVNSLDISVEPTADSLSRRDSDGRIKASDGVDNDDVATVKQLSAAASNAAEAARKAESIAMSALVFSNLFQEQ